MMAALVATLQGRFQEAEPLTELAEAATFRPQDRPMRAATALPRLVLLSVRGRHGDAFDLTREAIESIGSFPVDAMVSDALFAWQARLAAAFGDPVEAAAVLDRAPHPAGGLVVATRARLRLDERDAAVAAALVEDRIAVGDPLFPSVLIDLHLVAAMARDALAEPQATASHLERALDLAAPADLIRPLVSHGAALLPLLRRHSRATRHGDLTERAIMLIEGRSPATRASTRLIEPLSAREQQVLGYLPSIMSNRDIAAQLCLSVNTVKTHARSIYRKLGVTGRRDAVDVARELNLFAGR
jgi:LuxR family maltose regulon positive regulatory protein